MLLTAVLAGYSAKPGPAGGQTAQEAEDVFWGDVGCEQAAEVQAYLEAYPTGRYVGEALTCLEAGLGLTRAERQLVQQGLVEAGQEPGPVDGLFGARTRTAIREWQATQGFEETIYLNREQADSLIALGEAARQEAASRQAAADDAAYADAEQTDSAAAYGAYLAAYPTGRHASEAQERQAARERQAALQRAEALRPGQMFRDTLRSGDEGPQMVVVPAGTFQMGSPLSEAGREDDEGPERQVTIAEPFAVGTYEVTFEEWEACVRSGGCGGYRPDDEGWGRDRRPVINVSWEDAQAYVRWLSEQTGAKYRLLSEAEWEYTARAGSTTAYSWGDTMGHNRANCDGCGSQWDNEQTAPVGSFEANAFGVHDLHGNVWEWVEDCWNDSYQEAPRDGTAWTRENCDRCVLRGGSQFNSPRDLRSANRLWNATVRRNRNVGFRVAWGLD